MSQRQNVTISLPPDVLQRLRHAAVDRGTSLSGLIGNVLQEWITHDADYQEARNYSVRMMEQGFDMGTGGRITWTRDELYER